MATMSRSNKLVKRLLVAAAVSAPILLPSLTRGGATDVPQQGARASGQAEAFAAQADDPSAIWHNPAGITQLRGFQAQVGGTFIFPQWKFEPANGGPGQGMYMPTVVPTVYLVSDLGTENLRVGLGIGNSFGLNEEWKNDGPLVNLVTQAHLYIYNIAPSIAYKFNDHLSVGVDANIYWGDLELTRQVPLGSESGTFHFRGEDAAFGVTPAVMWKIDNHNTIGAVYRSPFEFGYTGDARLKAKGMQEIGPAHSHVYQKMPQMATLAYAVRPVDQWKIEADVVWTDWDVVKNTTVTSTNSNFRQVTPNNWMSGFSFRLGTQIDLTHKLALRLGYAYGQNAVPQSTYGPLVPDSNYHLGSIGIGYQLSENIIIDAAYQYIFRETRNISNSINSPAVDGKWHNSFNEFMLSTTIRL